MLVPVAGRPSLSRMGEPISSASARASARAFSSARALAIISRYPSADLVAAVISSASSAVRSRPSWSAVSMIRATSSSCSSRPLV